AAAAQVTDYPTANRLMVAESGLPGYDAVAWFGLFGPLGMPTDIVAKINAEVRKTFVDLDITRNFLDRQYFESIAGAPDELAGRIRSEESKWRKVMPRCRRSKPARTGASVLVSGVRA